MVVTSDRAVVAGAAAAVVGATVRDRGRRARRCDGGRRGRRRCPLGNRDIGVDRASLERGVDGWLGRAGRSGRLVVTGARSNHHSQHHQHRNSSTHDEVASHTSIFHLRRTAIQGRKSSGVPERNRHPESDARRRTDFPSLARSSRTTCRSTTAHDSTCGHEQPDTAIAHLPPVTWNDVATKADLDALGTNLRTELRADLLETMNRQITWLVVFAAAWRPCWSPSSA